MFAREKDDKQKSEDRIHETVTPLSDMSGTAAAVLSNTTEKPTTIAVSRVTAPTPTPTSTLTPTPMVGARDNKNDAKNETKRLSSAVAFRSMARSRSAIGW